MVPLLLPSMKSELDLSSNQLAWVFNSYGLCVAVGVILVGWFGDMVRTVFVFALGTLAFSIGSLGVAFAQSYELMAFGRMVQGLGAGIFTPLIPILLTKASPEQPGRVLIIWGSIVGFVAAFAPLIYSGFLASYGFGLAFVFLAVVSLLGLAILLVGAQNDANAESDKVPPQFEELLRSPRLWSALGYVFCTYGAFTYFLFSFPLKLAAYDFQFMSIGLFLSMMWLSFSLLSTLLRNQVDGPNLGKIVFAAPVLMALGFVISTALSDIPWLMLSAVVIGAGLACSNAPSTQLILRFAPPGLVAFSASLDITVARLGGALCVASLTVTEPGVAAFSMVLLSGLALAFASFAMPNSKTAPST